MKKIIIISALLVLSGCENSTVNSPIVGGWETSQCLQLADENDNPINEWAKSIYEFDTNGIITRYNIYYSDADCVTRKNTFDYRQTAIYIDNGEALTPQGLNGNSITVSFDPELIVQGHYIIDNNQLCFSESISFLTGGYSVSSEENTVINFNNCLTSQEIPNK